VAGRTIHGRYRLVERVGTGAMAEVWRAEDTDLGRDVAVKLLAPDADPARFEREARAAASLSHPNVIQLYDYGELEDGRFIVLEYLPGGTLEQRLARGRPLPDPESARIAGEVAEGLAHAHAHGLVHRDLKPANILFDVDGRAKIADFGIARLTGAATLTEAGTLLGSAPTISPEQAAGEQATAASDVYAFGVVLFWMLTGRPPFADDDPLRLIALHRDRPAPAVRSVRPDAPPALAALADEALAKDPRARPPDGSALVARLAGRPVERPEPATLVLPRPHRRPLGPIALAVAAVVLLAAVGLAVALVAFGGSSSSSTSTSTSTHSSRSSTTSAPSPPAPPPPPSTTSSTTSSTTTTSSSTATSPPPPPPPPPTPEPTTSSTTVPTETSTTETTLTLPVP
jgi:serine/threonine protein kinase